jgi:hypothetical protein
MKKIYMLVIPGLLLGAHLTAARAAEEKKAKEVIWGSEFKGVAISVSPNKSRYRMGEKIEVIVNIRNVGEEEVMAISTEGFLENYRLALFDINGQPAGKTKRAEKFEAFLGQKPDGPSSGSTVRLNPGETFEIFQTFSLNDWIKIEKEGTYFLVVMCKLKMSWDEGFMISNTAKIIITNSENQPSPDQNYTPSENNTLGQNRRLEAGKYLVIGGLCAILILGSIALLKKASSRSK